MGGQPLTGEGGIRVWRATSVKWIHDIGTEYREVCARPSNLNYNSEHVHVNNRSKYRHVQKPTLSRCEGGVSGDRVRDAAVPVKVPGEVWNVFRKECAVVTWLPAAVMALTSVVFFIVDVDKYYFQKKNSVRQGHKDVRNRHSIEIDEQPTPVNTPPHSPAVMCA